MTVDIKKVLAMPKWEQAEFLFQYTNQKPYEERSKSHWLDLAGAIDAHHDAGSVTADYLLERALSFLAFRMRDEAQGLNSFIAKVYNIAHDYELAENEMHAPTVIVYIWFSTQAQPIHWILAAMLAKENDDGE